MKTEKKIRQVSRVVCPLCSSAQIKLIYSVNSNEVIKHLNFDKNDTLIHIVEKLWEGKSSQFYKCKECSFSFAWPFKSGNMEFYSAIYSDVKFYPKQKWDYSTTYNSIYKLGKSIDLKNINLLEIGAGNGSFIKSISPTLVPKEKILCTEFSNYGKGEILNYGVDCISVDLKDIDSSNNQNKFDIVCMFQVLEHIDKFDDFFKTINELARKNAHLFITVPNHKFREFYDSINFKLDLPPIHVSRWNKKTLEILCKKYQWDLNEYKIENPGFINKLRKLLNNRIQYFSFTKAINKIDNNYIGLPIKIISLIFIGFIYFPSVIKLFSTELGVAQWAHLQKK